MISGSRWLVAALCIAHGALVQAQGWGLPQLMQELATVKSADAYFVEQRYAPVLQRPLEVSGTLAYRAPDWLEKYTLQPKREALLLHGNTLILDDGEGRRQVFQLQDNRVLWGLVESIRATLAGDLEALRRYYEVSLRGSESGWALQLTPSEPELHDSLRQITIRGRASRILGVEILGVGGDRSVMTINQKRP